MNVGGRIKTLGLVWVLNCFLFRVTGEAAVKVYHWFCIRNVIRLVLARVVIKIMERFVNWGIVGTLVKIMESILMRTLEQILKGELFMLKTMF